MSVPYTFASATQALPLSELDDNFTYLNNQSGANTPYTPAGTGAVATTVQAKLRQYVSVFDFMTAAQVADVQSGAQTLDVSGAIAAAMTYVRSLVTGNAGTIYFPAGVYKISSVITLAGSKINFVGAGMENTVLVFSSTAYMTYSGDMSWTRITDMTMSGSYGSGSQLINFAQCYQSNFMRVRFASAQTLVTIAASEGYTHFTDCYFEYAGSVNGTWNGTCMVLSNTDEIVFDNCAIQTSAVGIQYNITSSKGISAIKIEKMHNESCAKPIVINNITATAPVYMGRISIQDSWAYMSSGGTFFTSSGLEAYFNNVQIYTPNKTDVIFDLKTYNSTGTASSTWYLRQDMPFGFDAYACVKLDNLVLGAANAPKCMTCDEYFIANTSGAFTTTGAVTATYTSPSTCLFSVSAGQTGSQQARIVPSYTNTTKTPNGKIVVVAFDYRFVTGAQDVTFYSPANDMGVLGGSQSTISAGLSGDSSFTLVHTNTSWTSAYVTCRYMLTGDANNYGFFYALMPTSGASTIATSFNIRNFRIMAVDRYPIGVIDVQ